MRDLLLYGDFNVLSVFILLRVLLSRNGSESTRLGNYSLERAILGGLIASVSTLLLGTIRQGERANYGNSL